MEPNDTDRLQPAETGAIVVVDLFESVKLFETVESLATQSWARFITAVNQQILPKSKAVLVKSMGDGLMLTCPNSIAGLQAAHQFHALAKSIADEFKIAFALRIGIHQSPFTTGHSDIHGHGVNLAARVASLAQPGETIITADVRDQITDGVDGTVEDMGYSFLKHVKEPIRTYRANDGKQAAIVAPDRIGTLGSVPVLAVVPFKCLRAQADGFAIGEIIADGLISRLSGSRSLQVISRLSASAVRDSVDLAATSASTLNATKLVHGSFVASGRQLLINAHLTDLITKQVIWSLRINCIVDDLIDAHSTALGKIGEGIHDFLFDSEVKAVANNRLNSISGYSLLLSGIGLMHRDSALEFEKSSAVLEHLQERYTRVPELRAWKAKWYVLKVLRGLSINRADDARHALSETARALDIDSSNSLALAVEGYVRCQLTDEIDEASKQIHLALLANPNESLAWLFKSVISAADQKSHSSIAEAQHASVLSPIDPIRYFYRMLIANAYLVQGDHLMAIEHCKESIRLNRCHSPTLRILLTAQFEARQIDDAKRTLEQLLELEPGLTVNRYLAGGNPLNRNRQRCASALKELGLALT